jgi:hypothetical protein
MLFPIGKCRSWIELLALASTAAIPGLAAGTPCENLGTLTIRDVPSNPHRRLTQPPQAAKWTGKGSADESRRHAQAVN